MDAQEALKRRVGSFVLVPLNTAQATIGFITAATHSRGGLDKPQIESLRIAAIELSQAFLRLEGKSSEPEGVMTPAEFGKRVQGTKGIFVYLEPLRREQLADTFGKSAVDLALRKFVGQLKRSLPKGGCVCRRDEGDYVVFLPKVSLEKATSWANDVTATSAMIAVRTADGSAKIPLALRSKVAAIDRQDSEVFDAISA
jgi:GGDEF domain-containing protein